MLAPPDPKMRRAALAGSPKSQSSHHSCITNSTETAAYFQAEKLRQLFCFFEKHLGEYETFGDDERLAREHAEYFCEEYADVYGGVLP